MCPATPNECDLYPDVHDALPALRRAGFRLVVVTNQPEVARGIQTRAGVEAIHAWLRGQVPLDEIRVCYHDDGECGCRKPQPGMLLADAAIDLARSFMIGDRWRDIEAGRRAGCTTVLVDRGYLDAPPCDPDVTVSSLGEAAAWILARAGATREHAP